MAQTEEILTNVKSKNKQIKSKVDKICSIQCSNLDINSQNVDLCSIEHIREKVKSKQIHANPQQ